MEKIVLYRYILQTIINIHYWTTLWQSRLSFLRSSCPHTSGLCQPHLSINNLFWKIIEWSVPYTTAIGFQPSTFTFQPSANWCQHGFSWDFIDLLVISLDTGNRKDTQQCFLNRLCLLKTFELRKFRDIFKNETMIKNSELGRATFLGWSTRLSWYP